jgi:hypothetical protein
MLETGFLLPHDSTCALGLSFVSKILYMRSCWLVVQCIRAFNRL